MELPVGLRDLRLRDGGRHRHPQPGRSAPVQSVAGPRGIGRPHGAPTTSPRCRRPAGSGLPGSACGSQTRRQPARRAERGPRGTGRTETAPELPRAKAHTGWAGPDDGWRGVHPPGQILRARGAPGCPLVPAGGRAAARRALPAEPPGAYAMETGTERGSLLRRNTPRCTPYTGGRQDHHKATSRRHTPGHISTAHHHHNLYGRSTSLWDVVGCIVGGHCGMHLLGKIILLLQPLRVGYENRPQKGGIYLITSARWFSKNFHPTHANLKTATSSPARVHRGGRLGVPGVLT